MIRLGIGFTAGFIVAILLAYYGVINVGNTAKIIEKGGSAISSKVSEEAIYMSGKPI